MINDFFPTANPLRFIITDEDSTQISIDYDNRLPQFDLMQMNTQYQAGIYPVEKPWSPDWKINEQLDFQLSGDLSATPVCIARGDGTGIATRVDITPVGYVGGRVFRFSYTPTTVGFYYFQLLFSSSSYAYEAISDTFYVTDTLADDKNLVELQFFSEENKNGYVFDQYYKAYYTGQIRRGQPQWTTSIFEEDQKRKLASQSFSRLNVVLNEIRDVYYENLCKQLENDIIRLNGIDYTCEDTPEAVYVEGTDMVNITFDLTSRYNNNLIIIS